MSSEMSVEDRDLARLMGLMLDRTYEPFPRDRSSAAWIGMNALAAKHRAPERDAMLSFFGLDANAGAEVDLGGGG